MNTPKRILVKLSGELFKYNERLTSLVQEIERISKNTQVIIVIGGGNWLRGSNASHINRTTADSMGILFTVANALWLSSLFHVKTKVLTSISADNLELFSKEKALRLLEKKCIIIIGGGLGLPYFSTDTAASLRSIELNVDILFKMSKVKGVYSEDPEINPNAEFYPSISYRDVLNKNLGVIDMHAVLHCEAHKVPIYILSIFTENVLQQSLNGHQMGSIIS